MSATTEIDNASENSGDDQAFGASWVGYLIVAAAVGGSTLLDVVLSRWLAITDLAMVYLLAVIVIATFCRLTLSIAGAILSFLAFDFFFVPPVFTLQFANYNHLITGAVLLTAGVVTGILASRVRLSLRVANRAALLASEEQLRNSVLASLSHDLRTPLSVIAGSASTLHENRAKLSIIEQDQLLETIFQQSRMLSSDVSDLLEMTRLHAGPVKLNRQWHPLEELIGSALERCKAQLKSHRIQVEIRPDTPLVFVDGVLMEKLFINLLENAGKYTLPGTLIGITVAHTASNVDVVIEDDGPGLPEGFETHLFKKFSRAKPESSISGSGLGLSICRAISHLHDMNLIGRNRPLGGAQFVLSIPFRDPPVAPGQGHE